MNLPCHVGDVGWIPGQGTKIPHATEELSLHATITEAYMLWSSRATTRESLCHDERSNVMQQRPCVPQLRLDTAK